jgi:hypothetical protein
LEKEPELKSGRHLLYVCPECGDIGCGAVTVLLSSEGDQISWLKFRYENNYDEDMWEEDAYRMIGPFQFSKEQYREALLNPPPKEAMWKLQNRN